MTTNATMLTPERLDAIFDGGVFGMAVSIDGFAPETFARIRKKGDISTVFEALDEIVRRKKAAGRQALDTPRLQINYTLMKSNLHELIPLIEHSRRWGLESFVVTHVYSPPGRDMTYESLVDSPEESDSVLIEAEDRCRQYGIPGRFPPLFRPRPTAEASSEARWWERLARRFSELAPPEESSQQPGLDLSCAAPWRMLKIRWDGEVYPCDLWNATKPLGNLQTQSFQEIWMSEKYTELRSGLYQGVPTFDQCIHCDRISQDNLEGRKLTSPLAHTSVGNVSS